jgi:hypothetical protein
MEALRTVVDHPYVLIVALLLSFPCFILVAQTIFPDPEQDAEDSAWAAPFVLLGQTPMTILSMKLVAFFAVCGAFTTLFYKLGAWLVSWF